MWLQSDFIMYLFLGHWVWPLRIVFKCKSGKLFFLFLVYFWSFERTPLCTVRYNV